MKYDIIHFEALGAEAEHLKEETIRSQKEGHLPAELRYLITTDNVQDFLAKNPQVELPEIITTKTHSVLPKSYLDGVKKAS